MDGYKPTFVWTDEVSGESKPIKFTDSMSPTWDDAKKYGYEHDPQKVDSLLMKWTDRVHFDQWYASKSPSSLNWEFEIKFYVDNDPMKIKILIGYGFVEDVVGNTTTLADADLVLIGHISDMFMDQFMKKYIIESKDFINLRYKLYFWLKAMWIKTQSPQVSIGNHGSYSTYHAQTYQNDYFKLITGEGGAKIDGESVSSISRRLPGMEYSTHCPVEDCPSTEYTKFKNSLWTLIQHINDFHKWDRATQIADWLDKLHDDGIVDLSFPTPDN